MDNKAGAVAMGVRSVEISAEQEGQRIDNFLIRQFKGVPKSRIYRMVRRGEVRVNRGRIRPTYRLKTGDLVRLPPVRIAQTAKPKLSHQSFDWLESRILYEDSRMLVLNKPSGLAVHGGSGLSHGVIEAMRAARPKAPFLELVHRLDRDTSGCLILAKRRSQLRALHEMLRQGTIEKRYITLLKGRWGKRPKNVTAPLMKRQLHNGDRVSRVDAEGKSARTRFIPQQVYDQASLMEVELGTGRTHQIRVHAAHIGFPVAGDEKYGDQQFNREMRSHGLRRLFLQAASLQFQDPYSGNRIKVEAPQDEDLEKVLKSFS